MVGKYLITCLLLALLLTALVQSSVVQGVGGLGGRFWWLYEGLRASYMVSSSTLKSTPGKPYAPGMEWGVGTYSKAGSVSVIYTYIVTSVDRDGVGIREISWEGREFSIVTNERYKVGVAPNGLLDGPFWIDPRRLVNVRLGSKVVLGSPGHERTYLVTYVGRVDISPFSKSNDLISKSLREVIAIPVPPGTYRNIVILYTSDRNPRTGEKEYHRLIVDRDTGIILAELLRGFKSRYLEGASVYVQGSLVVRSLVELTLDLEDKLPPYSNFDYGNLMHPGYAYMVFGGAGSIYNSVQVSWGTFVFSVYKDRAVIGEFLLVGTSSGSASAEIFLYLLNLSTCEAKVIRYVRFLGYPIVGNLTGRSFKLIPIYIGRYVNDDSVTIMGINYVSEGVKEVSTKSGGTVRVKVFRAEGSSRSVGFAVLYYLENGVLAAAIPSINGYPARNFLTSASTYQYLASLPYVKPSPPKPPKEVLTTSTTSSATRTSKELVTTSAIKTKEQVVSTTSVTTSSPTKLSTSSRTSSVPMNKSLTKEVKTQSKPKSTTSKETTLRKGRSTSSTSSTSVTTSEGKVVTTSSRGGGSGGTGSVPSTVITAVVAALVASVITALVMRRRR